MSDTQFQDSATSSRINASPGELLLRQREQLGVPLGEAARALNLRPAVVEGLEQDRYDEIPVAAYRRGYLRAYARYLGLDDRLVLDSYQERFGAADAERKVAPVSVNRPPSKLGVWLFRLMTVLVIAGLIGVTVMWWQSRGGSEPPSFDESPAMEENNELPPGAQEGAEPAPPTTPALSSEQPGARLTQPDEEADAAETTESQAAPAETEQTATVNDVAALDLAANISGEAAEEPAPAGSTNRLELTFNEQSWTEIFDANNQRVFVGLQTPGTTATVEGEPPFRLTVGNATGVVLRYQGEQVNLVERAGANNVARFTLGE
ncbi:RodZ domain-containing protein [Vreelandella populi]|uniref:Helix-turn-helix domain-containing protein n=1 Tax=Vreelandella populi TaxID=2498858 RepID=A0A3S0X1T8_9GAMM|nr:RodZ domain-containing protein [Halomonas populi]RUR46584.1 helix-turn-helix domain-containing protein [Halomonas populi]RUR52915.1 helix-turn-helix domain-containing protein [Halomonas populi]